MISKDTVFSFCLRGNEIRLKLVTKANTAFNNDVYRELSGGIIESNTWHQLFYFIHFVGNQDTVVRFFNYKREVGTTETIFDEYYHDNKSKRLTYGAELVSAADNTFGNFFVGNIAEVKGISNAIIEENQIEQRRLQS
jgi:hypothetical protein